MTKVISLAHFLQKDNDADLINGRQFSRRTESRRARSIRTGPGSHCIQSAEFRARV